MSRKLLAAIIMAALLVAAYSYNTLRPNGIAQTPDKGAAGKPMVEVVLPTLAAGEVLGETAFNAKCAACHGANAAGQLGVAPPLVHKYYEPSHHGDMAFIMAAQNGVKAHHWPFGDMPPVAGLTQGAVKNIVAYVRALQRANGIN